MKFIKSCFFFLLGLLCLVYLANPTAGFFEIIPDNLPLVGNIDETSVTLLLLYCLSYFGLDFRKKGKASPKELG